eukprot:8709388-Alexandrium_andersonii.AAC.1
MSASLVGSEMCIRDRSWSPPASDNRPGGCPGTRSPRGCPCRPPGGRRRGRLSARARPPPRSAPTCPRAASERGGRPRTSRAR